MSSLNAQDLRANAAALSHLSERLTQGDTSQALSVWAEKLLTMADTFGDHSARDVANVLEFSAFLLRVAKTDPLYVIASFDCPAVPGEKISTFH
jgi:hypothetical protein